RELRSRGVDVYFEQENIRLLDPAAQHAIEIYCALAQNESENKSHNIKWGVQAGFEQGTSGYQHFACYGYRFDEIMQTLVIIPTEAEVVRMIFDLRLQGYSYGKISAELAKRDIQSPTGKLIWSRESIRKLLCNEKCAGAVILQKTYVKDFFTGKQKKNVGQLQRYLYKNNHKAIVPWEIFKRVQEI
ncbi:MAG: recombinase family protein, partial [Oscillospiraceae bacterium]